VGFATGQAGPGTAAGGGSPAEKAARDEQLHYYGASLTGAAPK